MKFLIRGSSIAAGFGVNKGYAEILADRLASSNIEIINRSRYRETSFNGVWTFDDDILPYKPDVLILNFAIDDAFYPVYRSEFQENHVQIIRRARNIFNPLIMLATSHTFDDTYEMDAVNIYYRSLRTIANDLDCRLIPVDTLWASYIHENHLKSSDLTLKDSRYPNESGHKIFADALFSVICSIKI